MTRRDMTKLPIIAFTLTIGTSMTRREEIEQKIADIHDQICDLGYQVDHLEDELEALDDIEPEGNDDDYGFGTESDYPIDDDGVN